MENDAAAILALNERFYVAFRELDFEAIAACWAQTEADFCVHPGWEMLRGWEEVRESWRAIVAGAAYMRIHPSEEVVVVHGDMGHVTCVEEIYTIAGGVTTHARVASTTLFIRTPLGWRIEGHHGSPIAAALSVNDEVEN